MSAVGVFPCPPHLPVPEAGERGRRCLRPLSMAWRLVTLQTWVGFHCRINSLQPFSAQVPCMSGPTRCCFLHHPWDFFPPMMLCTCFSPLASEHHAPACSVFTQFLSFPLKTVSLPDVAYCCLKVDLFFFKIPFYILKAILSRM